MRTYTEQLSFIPGWLEFALTLITLLIFYFYLDFISHSTREESVPVKSLFESKEYSIGKKCSGL